MGVTANANTVRNNIVSSSLNDGFLADTSSGGNTILHNSSQLNGNLDAQDLSTGAGTPTNPSGLAQIAAYEKDFRNQIAEQIVSRTESEAT